MRINKRVRIVLFLTICTLCFSKYLLLSQYKHYVILPEVESLFFWYIHFVVFVYVECFVPCIDMWKGTVNSPFAERVGVALCAVAYLCLCDVACPHSCISEEETLVGGQTIDVREFSLFCCVFISIKSNL